jgi:plasmid stabilization system protein ParE
MRLAYHPLVQHDVSEILRHYDRITPRLGDEFWAELMRLVELITAKPERFHFADRGLRRANMRRFPYHLLFRETVNGVRVIVVRHDRRHPNYGTGRR